MSRNLRSIWKAWPAVMLVSLAACGSNDAVQGPASSTGAVTPPPAGGSTPSPTGGVTLPPTGGSTPPPPTGGVTPPPIGGGAPPGTAAPGVKWSTLGVVADGTRDNTQALNALPPNVNIVGDCPAGGSIVLKSPWIWKSNLSIAVQAGCKIVSFVTGGGTGSYAITQSNLDQPITNVSVTGLQVSSHYAAQADRIMYLWVNNFTLLHWTVTSSGGVMFIRGSNQEIAYGTVTGTVGTTGNPGIRHVGNVPKVPTSPGRPANVYIHDNNIQSGDAVYQACQPLATNRWTNVSSDDILYQNNVGRSTESGLVLIGEDATSLRGYADWTCSNIVYDNVNGSGTNRGIRIVSGDPANKVSGIKIENSVLDASTNSRPFGAVELYAVGGTMSDVTFDNVSIQNVNRVALTTFGNVTGFVFQNGAIDAPVLGGDATVVISDATETSILNSSIGAKSGDVIQLGPNDAAGVRHPVSGLTVSGNTFHGVANGFAAVRMENASRGTIAQNTMISDAGAASSTGIYFSVQGPLGPGTTDSTATANNLAEIAGVPIVFAPGQGNSATNNNL